MSSICHVNKSIKWSGSLKRKCVATGRRLKFQQVEHVGGRPWIEPVQETAALPWSVVRELLNSGVYTQETRIFDFQLFCRVLNAGISRCGSQRAALQWNPIKWFGLTQKTPIAKSR